MTAKPWISSSFNWQAKRYGIESIWVKEVRPLRQLVPVPGTPPFVLGIVSVGGQVIFRHRPQGIF